MYRHRLDIANYGPRTDICTCQAMWNFDASECSSVIPFARFGEPQECKDCAKVICTCDDDYDAWKASELDRWDWN